MKFISSSIGRKLLVALSSIFLIGFLFAHLLGNLLFFKGPDAINAYSQTLHDYPVFLWFARIGLLTIFIIHMGLGLKLSLENRKARPQGYSKKNTVQASLASRFMATSGLVMLSYIVYHLLHFSLGLAHPELTSLPLDKLAQEDIYQMIILSFQKPIIVITYFIALFVTMLHLSHGIPSLFQSTGLSSASHRKKSNIWVVSWLSFSFLVIALSQ